MVDLKVFFFKTLYQWTTAYERFHITSYHDFLNLFSFSD
jgi:hypothetical protein